MRVRQTGDAVGAAKDPRVAHITQSAVYAAPDGLSSIDSCNRSPVVEPFSEIATLIAIFTVCNSTLVFPSQSPCLPAFTALRYPQVGLNYLVRSVD